MSSKEIMYYKETTSKEYVECMWQGDNEPLHLHPGYCNGNLADCVLRDNALIAGTTGAGKSNLCNVLLLDLMMQLPPDKFGFTYLDGSKGCEVGTYIARDGHVKSPHMIAYYDGNTEPDVGKTLAITMNWAMRHPGARTVIIADEFTRLPMSLYSWSLFAEGFRKHNIHVIFTSQLNDDEVIRSLLYTVDCSLRISLRSPDRVVEATLGKLSDEPIKQKAGLADILETSKEVVDRVEVPFVDWRYLDDCLSNFKDKAGGAVNLWKLQWCYTDMQAYDERMRTVMWTHHHIDN